MMQVNIQHVFDKQKANFDHFNELKTLILSIIHQILSTVFTRSKSRGGGASIRINTVLRFKFW